MHECEAETLAKKKEVAPVLLTPDVSRERHREKGRESPCHTTQQELQKLDVEEGPTPMDAIKRFANGRRGPRWCC